MRFLAVSSFAFLVAFSGFAQAEETLTAGSKVTAATVFADRALVTREAKIHVPTGAHTLIISDVPAGLDESSLRVQGKAEANVKIGSTEVKNIFLTEAANTIEREKNSAIQSKLDAKEIVNSEIKALEMRQAFIERIVEQGAQKHDATLSKMDFAPEKWAQAWKLVETGVAETQKDMAAKRIALRTLDEEISKLQAELNQVRSGQAKQRRDVYVNVDAAQDTELTLTLTYQSGGATWRPVYDARLDTTKGVMDLEQYGQVSQQTGEDWKDVEVTLSTAQAAMGSEMPRMKEWFVQLFNPVLRQAELSSASMMGGAMLQNKVQSNMPAAAPMVGYDALKEEVAKKVAELPAAIAQTSEYAAEFRVPGHVDLKSVRDTTKLFVGATHMNVGLAAQVAPRLTPVAYLFVKATNAEKYPLIPGTVAKYRDNAFIGNAALPLLRSNETANLSFGVDERIKVTYHRVSEEQSNPAMLVMGDMKTARVYETKVQNLHQTPLTVTVFEQYPVASDPDVKSELLDDKTSPGFVADSDKRQNVITWSSSLKPKEEQTYTLGFQVKYPKGRQILGL